MQAPQDLSKERLINDLVKLRQRIDDLEKIEEEKQKYEDELAQTRAMFEGLFEFAPDAILVIGSNGGIVQVNQQAEQLFGYRREELTGADHDMVVPDRFRKRHLEDRTNYMSAPHVRHMGTGLELYGRRKDGTEFPVDIALGPLTMKDDIVTLAVVRDFTEHKQALDKIAGLAALVEFSTDAIIGKTPEGKIVSWNPGAEAMYGYSAEEIMGRSISLLSPPDCSDELPRILEKAGRGETFKHYRTLHIRKDGTPIDVSLSVSPIKDSVGTIVGTVTITHDITDRMKIETDLADQAAELQKRATQVEEINKELESFSYSVSHDLRAPLRAIDGYARMILRQQGDKFDENARRQFKVIRDNTKRMGQLIDDILAFSRLGRAELTLSQLNVEELAREVWGELKTNNPDRSLNLKIAPLPPGMGDRPLIRQVLVNLLSNAVKFSRVREVPLISVGAYDAEGENVYYVRDNGVGFDMQYHDKLFGVFQRLHSADDFEGTGVGLAIVQRIIHRHGGRTWAEGKIDEGACFYFTLRKA